MNLDRELKELLNTESEFEKKRRANIEANNEIFKQLFPGGILEGIQPTFTKIVKGRSHTPRTRTVITSIQRAPISRSCKRKRYDDEEDTYNSDGEKTTPSSNYIRFAFGKKKKKLANDDYCDTPIHKKRRSAPFARRAYDERVAEEDLVLVAEKTSDKSYDSVDGSSCHQCRQKTDDLKTICRSKTCVGVRGQFCGPCLRNRYGECAKEAIISTEWECPPCRGICNCSFCMKKKGKRATGILIYLAKENGFSDVSKFLGDIPKEKSESIE